MKAAKAIEVALADIHTMHGSVVGDPECLTNPNRCSCTRGKALRALRELKRTLVLKPMRPIKEVCR